MNPAAGRLINLSRICWDCASKNPELIHLLSQNEDKVNWSVLTLNPAIFDYDYQTLAKERTRIIEEDLLMNTLHPRRIKALLDAGFSIDDI
jgi:hypothetical protein